MLASRVAAGPSSGTKRRSSREAIDPQDDDEAAQMEQSPASAAAASSSSGSFLHASALSFGEPLSASAALDAASTRRSARSKRASRGSSMSQFDEGHYSGMDDMTPPLPYYTEQASSSVENLARSSRAGTTRLNSGSKAAAVRARQNGRQTLGDISNKQPLQSCKPGDTLKPRAATAAVAAATDPSVKKLGGIGQSTLLSARVVSTSNALQPSASSASLHTVAATAEEEEAPAMPASLLQPLGEPQPVTAAAEEEDLLNSSMESNESCATLGVGALQINNSSSSSAAQEYPTLPAAAASGRLSAASAVTTAAEGVRSASDDSMLDDCVVPETPSVLTTEASTLTINMAQAHLSSSSASSSSAAAASSSAAASSVTILPVAFVASAPGEFAAMAIEAEAAAGASAASSSSAAAAAAAAYTEGDEIPSAIPAPTEAASAVAAAAAAAAPVPSTAQYPLLEYSADIWQTLRADELKYLPSPRYMDEVQVDLSHFMRSILMDWLVEVAQEYSLENQTLFLCVSYVDRFLSIHPVDRAKLQLLGVASMLLAAKFWEIRAPSIEEFVYIADRTYSREQILAMEGVLLNTLGFAMMSVTPIDCAGRIIVELGTAVVPQHTWFLAELMMELFVLEPSYLHYRPSIVGVSAIFLALYTTHANPWPAQLELLCGLDVDSIQMCVRAMHASYLKHAQNPEGLPTGPGVPPLMAIREKYAQDKYLGVADIMPRLL